MSAKTDYLIAKVLNCTLRGVVFTPPTTVYLGLLSSDPTHTGSASSELANGDYIRRAITFGAPSGGKVVSTNAITFPAPTSTWAQASYWGIFDAISGGNMLYQGVLSTPRTVKLGDTPITIGVGGITIEEE